MGSNSLVFFFLKQKSKFEALIHFIILLGKIVRKIYEWNQWRWLGGGQKCLYLLDFFLLGLEKLLFWWYFHCKMPSWRNWKQKFVPILDFGKHIYHPSPPINFSGLMQPVEIGTSVEIKPTIPSSVSWHCLIQTNLCLSLQVP